MPPPISTTASNSSATSHGADLAKRPHPLGAFDEHNENLHGVEFEAPFSSESQKPPLTKGRFSIDFSIELERQLEMEGSPPSSPPAAVDTHGNMNANEPVADGHSITEGDTTVNEHLDKDLLDPEILAHIVMQLRQSLSEMTKERDELVKMLAGANAEEANVKDALQLMTEKATQVEEELGEAKRRMKEDEEQIALLRAKVEESRRGLMRLQTENRRQSMTPIDITRASSLTLPNFGNPPSSKRASFAPLTGSRHGRIPSVSDNNLVSPDTPNFHGDTSLSPNPPSSSRRFSGLFGRVSPGIPDNEPEAQSPPPPPPPPHAEIEPLKAEVKSLKSELESVKHDLAEANEAKEASETCVKVLREFIAENNIGAMAVKLPPPPTMASGAQDATSDAVAGEPKKTGSGWGFKLWGSGSGGSSTSSGSMPDPHGVATPPPMSAAPSGTYGLPPTPATTVASPPAPSPAPLSRKLTGLFSSRSSISSRGSSARAKSQPGSSGAGAIGSPLIDRTNSTYSYSDASSVVEPISPTLANDVVGSGLGFGVVRDVTNLDLVGGEKRQEETPPMSLHEVDLENELR